MPAATDLSSDSLPGRGCSFRIIVYICIRNRGFRIDRAIKARALDSAVFLFSSMLRGLRYYLSVVFFDWRDLRVCSLASSKDEGCFIISATDNVAFSMYSL